MRYSLIINYNLAFKDDAFYKLRKLKKTRKGLLVDYQKNWILSYSIIYDSKSILLDCWYCYAKR